MLDSLLLHFDHIALSEEEKFGLSRPFHHLLFVDQQEFLGILKVPGQIKQLPGIFLCTGTSGIIGGQGFQCSGFLSEDVFEIAVEQGLVIVLLGYHIGVLHARFSISLQVVPVLAKELNPFLE